MPAIRICHECRDAAFEAELKRLRLSLPEGMLERSGTNSSKPNKRKSRLYYRCFHLEDSFTLDIDGQKISIRHGDDHSFVSTLKGHLKESDATSLVPKYAFSGLRRNEKAFGAQKRADISESNAGIPSRKRDSPNKPSTPTRPDNGTSPTKKSGLLFEDDPLFGKIPEKPESPVVTHPSSIKNVEGVVIDESF